MPGGDRTGPCGEGPQTGRGLGYCSGEEAPERDRRFGGGMGLGRRCRWGAGRGFGWQSGRGFGRGFRRGFGGGPGRGVARGFGGGSGRGFGRGSQEEAGDHTQSETQNPDAED